MSIDGGYRRPPPTITDPGQRPAAEADVVLPGGSVEADRDWARNRIARFIRGNEARVMRKDAGQAESGKHAPVSQPGEPAEREADAVADHVAEQLHGGGKEGEKPAEPGKEQVAAISAKLAPGAISLARNNNPNQLSLPAPVGGQHQQQQHQAGGQLAPHPEKRYVTVENGKYMLKPEYRDSIRDRFYGKAYRSNVEKWKIQQLSIPKSRGGLRHETDKSKYWYNGQWYKNEGTTKASIGHEKPPVAQHWNETGSKTTQPVRVNYFNGDGAPEVNLIIQPLSINSSEGAAKGDRYTFEVSADFRGP